MKDSPSKVDQIGVKVRTANDAVQSIKQLRKEIVEIMTTLLCLAKTKNPKGMLPLCNEMVSKTRSLLNIWEPNLVEEAFAFIEKHRIIDEPESNTPMKMSPFRNITQQLGALDLKSPDLEDFASPMGPMPDFWSTQMKMCSESLSSDVMDSNRNVMKTSASEQSNNFGASDEIKFNLNAAVSNFAKNPYAFECADAVMEDTSLTFSETHFDVSGEVISLPMLGNDGTATDGKPMNNVPIIQSAALLRHTLDDYDKAKSLDYCTTFMMENQLTESKNEILLNSNEFDENGKVRNCSIALGQNGAFLDTKVSVIRIHCNHSTDFNSNSQAMSSSPSANYYRPTEEPEPLDLTQLNIEASVMCLVSKVKFLCGRCGSPAVRLRQPKSSARRGFNAIQSVSIS